IVAGGMESMSNAPYLLRGLRQGLPLGEHAMEDANLTDGLVDAYGGGHMGLGGEKAAAKAGLSREDQDRFALRSYEKALAAQRSGAFDAEIVPVEVKGRKGQVTRIERDESPRETSLEALAALKPAFKADGTVTAGNASNVNGGAVALGHPIGSSGARLLVTLLYALRDRGKTRGVVSLCLGGGEAVAVAVETR